MEGVVAAAAEVHPGPCGGGDADFDRCDGSIERAEELVVGVIAVIALPSLQMDVCLLPILCCVGREIQWLGCLAGKGAGLWLSEITPTEEGLSVEACEEGVRFANFNGVAEGVELLAEGVALPFAVSTEGVLADGDAHRGGFLVLDVAAEDPEIALVGEKAAEGLGGVVAGEAFALDDLRRGHG